MLSLLISSWITIDISILIPLLFGIVSWISLRILLYTWWLFRSPLSYFLISLIFLKSLSAAKLLLIAIWSVYFLIFIYVFWRIVCEHIQVLNYVPTTSRWSLWVVTSISRHLVTNQTLHRANASWQSSITVIESLRSYSWILLSISRMVTAIAWDFSSFHP